VLRDGPYGIGSVQLFIDADQEAHLFTMQKEGGFDHTIERLAVFDVLANNADRKSGHCLLGPEGRIFAIDNGLILHVDPKLRTVIWDFAGEPIPPSLLGDLRRLIKDGLPGALAELVVAEECQALLARGRALTKMAAFPADPSGMRYPWPLV
jgi:uncharacterized repeat protein (TIGR03843 family)